MATSCCDPDLDALISRLAWGLAPGDRSAFLAAAESAIAGLPCVGPGIAFRVVSSLWRGYFHPPADNYAAHAGAHHHRSSKLRALPAVGAEDPRTGARDRNRLRAV